MDKQEIKELTAIHFNRLIEFLRGHQDATNGREIAVAITQLETAELWAYKAIKKL